MPFFKRAANSSLIACRHCGEVLATVKDEGSTSSTLARKSCLVRLEGRVAGVVVVARISVRSLVLRGGVPESVVAVGPWIAGKVEDIGVAGVVGEGGSFVGDEAT